MDFGTINNIGLGSAYYCIHLFKTKAKDRAITVSKPKDYIPKMSLRCLRWFKLNTSKISGGKIDLFLNHLRHLRDILVGNESAAIVNPNLLQ